MADKPPELRGGWKFVGVGADMVVATAMGALVGWWLDSKLGTEPWMLCVWFLLGVVAGFYMVYRKMQEGTNQKPPEKRDE